MTLILLVTCYLLLVTPAFAQTSNPNANTPEEQAIFNVNSNLPSDAVPQNCDTTNNPVTSFIQSITNWVSDLLFLHTPNHKAKTFCQSGSAQGAQLPPELKPNPSSSPIDQLKQDLGGSSGVYGASLPNLGQDGISQSEKAYEQSNFPPGVCPITCSPSPNQ